MVNNLQNSDTGKPQLRGKACQASNDNDSCNRVSTEPAYSISTISTIDRQSLAAAAKEAATVKPSALPHNLPRK